MSGTFAVPAITMDAAHSVGDGAKTQYYLTNSLVGRLLTRLLLLRRVIVGMILEPALAWF